jgi:small-conductance mechanosensitive channel
MFRIRRRKILDVTQYHSIAAVVYFVLLMPLGITVTLTGWQPSPILAALGLAALIGWLGQSTIGYLYKIVPFLIWQTRYGPLVGYQKVPLMRDLIHESWARVSCWLVNVGLAVTLFSLVLGWALVAQIASGLLGIGFMLAAINIVGVIRHLSRRTTAEGVQV